MVTSIKSGEGLPAARFLMVVASLSPLFLLWGIVGNKIISDKSWWIICGSLILLPNLVLFWRFTRARKNKDTISVRVYGVEDFRAHLLTYLIATLLPFYATPISSSRELIAVIAALFIVVFIFWRTNLHYMNVVFSIFGYNIFSILVEENKSRNVIVLSKRDFIKTGSEMVGFRISNSVLVER